MVVIRNPGKMARHAAYARARGMDDTADTLEDALTRAGRCRRCGRDLSDPISVKRGVGPDCWQRALDQAVDRHPAGGAA